jgi:hypothetical protein
MSTMLIDNDILSQITPLRVRPGGDDLGIKIELAARTKFDFVSEILLYKWEGGNNRGLSVGAARGREQIVNEYAELYDRYPESVPRTASKVVRSSVTAAGLQVLSSRSPKNVSTRGTI